ncbi:hypothetical protein BVI434_1120015 [Burkholderia vietnamiensis]|nr:hypothetical protein BVI434_1120015 [Burkholderia vietnamiensis]
MCCSSKNARTCSGNSARNSTPTGSGSGLMTCSGGGMRVGLSSMIVSPAGSIIINLALGFMPEANR